MRFEYDPTPRDVKLARWHKWFAWYPVITKPGEYTWLETIECRSPGRSKLMRDGKCIRYWEYRRLNNTCQKTEPKDDTTKNESVTELGRS